MMTVRELKNEGLLEFGVSLVRCQIRPCHGWRERRKRKKLDRKRQIVERICSDIHNDLTLCGSPNEFSEEAAVGVALLGIPVWMFFLRLFAAEVGKWAFRRLVHDYEKTGRFHRWEPKGQSRHRGGSGPGYQ